MNRRKISIARLIGYSIVAAFALFLVYLPIGCYLSVCISKTEKTISDLAGFDFTMINTNCDSLAKEESVSVFISKPGRGKKTLIFAYDPIYDTANLPILPMVRFDSPNVLTIAISEVSSVQFQRHEWKSISIRYEILRVFYPILERGD